MGPRVACHENDLCHTMESGLWVFISKLMASTIAALPVSFNKTKEEMLSDSGGSVLQVRVSLCVRSEFHPVTSFWIVDGHTLL